MEAPAKEEQNMDKDLHKRNCLSDKERYADLINGLLLEGEQKVHPDDLSDLDSQVSGWNTQSA